MNFFKYSLLISTSLFFSFHNCWAMDGADNDEDNIPSAKTSKNKTAKKQKKKDLTEMKDITDPNKGPNYRSIKFNLKKPNNDISYTEFFTGVKGIGALQPQDGQEYYVNEGKWEPINSGQPERVLRKVVPGRDGRKKVENTKTLPYRFHGQMIMKFANGKEYTGSGTLVGPNHVLTAGHNIFSHAKKEGWATSVTFIPALNGNNKPYGIAKGTILLSSKNWTENKQKEDDFGMVILDHPIGHQTGWAGLFSFIDDKNLQKNLIHVSGYPGDKGSKELWTMSHTIKNLQDETITYDIDTFPGQSGSGVWTQHGGGYYVIGVHTYGDNQENYATRLSKEKMNQVVKWMKNYQFKDNIPINISDLELAKKCFLISGAPYDVNNTSNGVMTLCFTKIESTFNYEHPALVFELFDPNSKAVQPPEVSVYITDYSGNTNSSGGSNLSVRVEEDRAPLSKVYRSNSDRSNDLLNTYEAATYQRYASWILPNQDLLKAYNKAITEQATNKKNYGNCVNYVRSIMKLAGLNNTDGMFIKSATNLKEYVNKHIHPQPNYTHKKDDFLDYEIINYNQ